MNTTQFSDEQYSSVYPKGIERHYWNQARNYIIKDFLKKNGLEGKRMLEIGCGVGVVLQALRTSGFDCFGVELASVSVEKKLEEYLFSGIDFGELPQQLVDSIEVVLLFDVIEHIENEKEILDRIRCAFPRLTHMVLTVPARKELWSNYDTHHGHFRRYTQTSLENTLNVSDFKTLYSSYFFHTLYIPARLLAYFNIERQTKVSPPRGLLIIFHKIIAFFFQLEYRIMPGQFLGTSIISVQRPDAKTDI